MVDNFSQVMLDKTTNFQFETFYNQNTHSWYLYSQTLNMYLVVPNEVNKIIDEYSIDEQELVLNKILAKRPSWIFDIKAYCNISWCLEKENYPNNIKEKLLEDSLDIVFAQNYDSSIKVIYGTAGEFDVHYKEEYYSDLEKMLKENPELNKDNWYEKVEENDGFINNTPCIAFILKQGSNIQNIDYLDSEYETIDEVIQNILFEFNWLRTHSD